MKKLSISILTVLISLQANAEVLTQDAALKLMQKSGCASCHAIDQTKIGPAYKEVSARYKSPDAATKAYLKGDSPIAYLTKKVRSGSNPKNKNWTKDSKGKVIAGVMTPNPPARIKDEDLKTMLEFILSL